MHKKKRFRFQKKYRLCTQSEINNLFKKGAFLNHGILKFKYLPKINHHCQVVIPISKRTGNSPHRNRIKRMIRESLRLSAPLKTLCYDIGIFVNKRPDKMPTFKEIRHSIDLFLNSLNK